MAVPGTTTSRNPIKGPCFLCIKLLKWVPVLFIFSIVVWSYYAFVVQLCIFTVESGAEKLTYLILYHIVLFMFLWAYYQTIFTPIGVVPDRFKLHEAELERLTRAESLEVQASILERFCQELPNRNRTINNTVRYCEKCRLIKPDRAHHCTVCGQCILKMDHHCPWVNNCVGYTNYKYFLLFLGYALIYCIFVSLTSLQYFIAFWKGHQHKKESTGSLEGMGRFHILFLFFVAVMFAISLASLFFYHLCLVSVNRTTLEAFRAPIFHNGPDKNGFNLGLARNFYEIFGDDLKLWFIPVYSTSGDGVSYPVRAPPPSSSYRTMENSQNSLGDGVSFEKRQTQEDMEELLYEVHYYDDE